MKVIKNDLIWLFAAATLIIVWGSIPLWAGYHYETPDLAYRGIYFDSQDYAVHLAMMEAGRHGETAYQFRFTTEPHASAYLRLFYIGLGHLGRITYLPSKTLFQIARWLFGYLALFVIYKLFEKVFREGFWAKTGFILAAMGSGLGWLQLIFNWTSGPITPIDFWLIDCYIFFSLSLFPHFAFVTIGMGIVFLLWFSYLDNPNWKIIGWISITSVLVQLVNPIALATVDAGLFGAALARWWSKGKVRKVDVRGLASLALAQLPLLAYNFIILNNNPIWSQFTEQNRTLSPPFDYYIWGLAPFLPFALIGAVDAVKRNSSAGIAALFWIVSGFILAYSPVYIQRRFLQNITLPLAILAVQGLIRLFESGRAQSPWMNRWKTGLVLSYLFMASLSSIQLSIGRTVYTQIHPSDLYYPRVLDNAARWFRQNAQYNEVVLASEQTSLVIAQTTGMRQYLGHEMETLYYADKLKLMDAYYLGEQDEIVTTPINYVIYGPNERLINPDYTPGPNLKIVYRTKDLKIYKVK